MTMSSFFMSSLPLVGIDTKDHPLNLFGTHTVTHVQIPVEMNQHLGTWSSPFPASKNIYLNLQTSGKNRSVVFISYYNSIKFKFLF